MRITPFAVNLPVKKLDYQRSICSTEYKKQRPVSWAMQSYRKSLGVNIMIRISDLTHTSTELN